MKKIIIMFFVSILLTSSCELFFLDEGAYGYEGIVVDANNNKSLNEVTCSMFIDDELHEEMITDSAGMFRLQWSGVINKNDARITFSKEKYEFVEMYASMGNNTYFNDTIFLKLLE